LKALDVKLRELVSREASGERLGHDEFRRELEAAHAATVGLTKYFGSSEVGKLDGQDPDVVMKRLECVDSAISFALGQALTEKEFSSNETGALFLGFAKIAQAFDCANTLKNELARADQPKGLTDTAAKLELAPAHVIERWLKGIIPGFGEGGKKDLSKETLLANNEKYFKNQFLHDVKIAFAKAGAAKKTMAKTYFTGTLYGVPAADVIDAIDCVGENLAFAEGVNFQAQQHTFGSDLRKELYKVLFRAEQCKKALETALQNAGRQPEKVTIDEDDTWAHNPDIGKSRLCVNVRTKPPQAFVSATFTGPGGYTADAPKSPLHADGTAQIRGIITQPGDYRKTLVVYDVSGKETATVTKTFTVAPPPQDGPATNPLCVKPTQ
jgi:hypothetical protein